MPNGTTSLFYLLILQQIKDGQTCFNDIYKQVWKRFQLSKGTFAKYCKELEFKQFVTVERSQGKKSHYELTDKGMMWMIKAHPLLPLLYELKKEL